MTDELEICRAVAARVEELEKDDSEQALVATGRLADWRGGYAKVARREGGIVLRPDAAKRLKVDVGDTVTWIAR